MSFQAPIFLLALLLVPAAIAVYARHERRRGRAAQAFASPATMPSVAPRRPGWRRHAAMVAYAVALAGLAVALARPEATVAVPEERATVILATDQSGSMQATDVEPSRLEAARRAGDDFLDDVPGEVKVGAVAFNHAVRRIEPPGTSREDVRRMLEALRPSGGTATGDALAASLRLLDRRSDRRRERAPAAVVLLSDGASTHGRDPVPVAREAARLRIPVHTVALGTAAGSIRVRDPSGGTRRRSVPPDTATLKRIATISGGRAFEAGDDLELDAVYERLGSQVSTRQEKREVTAAFAGGAALLILGGGLMSLRWFGRLP
jgi:Ca-activated chloride channel homolog